MKRSAWAYLLPALHLAACLTLPLGFLIPSISYIAIVWTFVMIADLPISLVAYFLGWGHPLSGNLDICCEDCLVAFAGLAVAEIQTTQLARFVGLRTCQRSRRGSARPS
jgi:hypothetical protein